MSASISNAISDATISSLANIAHGIEKEGLRVARDGTVAQTPHPKALGSTLTHPSITTDYSEALLEFITPKQTAIEDSLQTLLELHQFTARALDNELIWPSSMPCRLEGEASIPIAQYGRSNVGQMKHVYRRGLEVRYGRIMQAIAGIHYNVSLPNAFWESLQRDVNSHAGLETFRSERYFHLIRNVHRYSWLLYYLFGASPVLDASFFDGRAHELIRFDDKTYGLEYATSLRMSDLGYTNAAQKDLQISYDSLPDYVRTLTHAVHQPYPRYESLGIKDANGEYQQLNANILQIENEYYSEIRPKRVAYSGERPVQALQRGGVEYIEIRALDLNPFLPLGIDATAGYFLDAFVLYCLINESARQCPNEWAEIASNRSKIIKEGRNPKLRLTYCGEEHSVKGWVHTLLDGIDEAAALLDRAHGNDKHRDAVAAQRVKGDDPCATPSGQIMARVQNGESYFDLVERLAREHQDGFLGTPLDSARDAELKAAAVQSLEEQTEREAADTISFGEYLDAYNAI